MEDERSAPARKPAQWMLIVFGGLGLYAVVVALLNSERVKVDFLFFSANIRLLILLFLCLGVGFAGGFLFDHWHRRRKRASPK